MKKRPLFLISNDDSINSKGLEVLINIVKPFGDIVVVAPIEAHSGMSHAITMRFPLTFEKIKEEKHLEIYKCSGYPVDCVKIALNEILEKKPDYILSGINHGSNSSVAVIYSGTMAIAIEGALHSIPSVGFSIENFSLDADFSNVEKYIYVILKNLIKNGIPKGVCLNVNIPKDVKKVKGIKICKEAKGKWQEIFVKRKHPYGKDYFWLTGEFVDLENDKEKSDVFALENNYIAITPIKTDWTDYPTIKKLEKWDL